MSKTVLLTGATDGIGRETAKLLARAGHTILLHGRSDAKLADTASAVSSINRKAEIRTYRADLSRLDEVARLANEITNTEQSVDVVINNAGVFSAPDPLTPDGYDIRFIVNTVAPYLLTRLLLPALACNGRVVNLSSAAQAPVNLLALTGKTRLDDNQTYAQSKLAITMWTFHLAEQLGADGPTIVAVNPGSLLASKMVREAYGVAGSDLQIGAEILVRAALSDEFAGTSGRYFDNDRGQFASPHADALDTDKNAALVHAIEGVLEKSNV